MRPEVRPRGGALGLLFHPHVPMAAPSGGPQSAQHERPTPPCAPTRAASSASPRHCRIAPKLGTTPSPVAFTPLPLPSAHFPSLLANTLNENRELRARLEERERQLRDKDAELRRWEVAHKEYKERFPPTARAPTSSSFRTSSIKSALEDKINEAVTACMRAQPADPLAFVAKYLLGSAAPRSLESVEGVAPSASSSANSSQLRAVIEQKIGRRLYTPRVAAEDDASPVASNAS